MTESADIIVVGGGIAGVSVAYELVGEGASLLLLEAEDQLAYHSTGRSAALFISNYGPPSVRALTAASQTFFMTPPEGFAGHALVRPRGILTVAGLDSEHEMASFLADGAGVKAISTDEALAMVPLLRRDRLAAVAFEAEAREIDVHALHAGYSRGLKARGGRIKPAGLGCRDHGRDLRGTGRPRRRRRLGRRGCRAGGLATPWPGAQAAHGDHRGRTGWILRLLDLAGGRRRRP